MIYINDDKIRHFDAQDISIVTDFDKTLTCSESESTIGVFSKFLPNTYVEAKSVINDMEEKIIGNDEISNKYKNLFMKYIWKKKLILLSEYLKDTKLIQEIVHSGLFVFRDGAIESLNYLQKKYEVIINSSGIGDIIVSLLKHNACSFENIKIFSNFYNFDSASFDLTRCIFPTDKTNRYYRKEILNKQLILIGDTIEDLSMASPNQTSLSIGFLDMEYDKYLELFKKSFSIVATENESYSTLIKLLKL